MNTTPLPGDSDNSLLFKIAKVLDDGGSSGGVLSFNARIGAVTLTSADVTTALGFTPVNKAGDTMTGLFTIAGDLLDHLVLDRTAADTQGPTVQLYKRGSLGGGANAAVAASEGIINIRARAWDGSAYGSAGRLQVNASVTQSGTDHSTFFRVLLCPPGSTTEGEVFRVTTLASGTFLTLGGVAATNPGLKRNSTELQVRLGDDSNYAPLTSGLLTAATGGLAVVTDDSASIFAYPVLIKKRGTTGNAAAAVANASEVSVASFQAWNGAAYVTGAQIVVKTTQDQSSGNAGMQMDFRTSPNGSAAAGVRCLISASGNFLISNVATTEPTSLVGGLVFKDGTAASADPTTGSAIWSVGGAIQYRTSGANDGSGVTSHLHNRAAEQAGVGTNYTLTNSTAQVAFGTTNAAVTLPTAGTYLIEANVSIINGATADDIYDAKLRNTTDNADIGVNKKVSGGPASGRVNIYLSGLVTIAAASKVVSIFAFNETAARGSVESTTTDIRYIRLF